MTLSRLSGSEREGLFEGSLRSVDAWRLPAGPLVIASDDRTFVAATASAGELTLRRAETSWVVAELRATGGGIFDLRAFSPSSKLLAVNVLRPEESAPAVRVNYLLVLALPDR
jgi:hypothetical protein